MMQGELVIAALVLRSSHGQEVKLSPRELHEAYDRVDDLEVLVDEVGNTIIRLKEPTLQGVVISDLPMIE